MLSRMAVRRVIGYVRVSTRERRSTRPSRTTQRQEIERECARRGWQVQRIEEDLRSGRSLRRPGLTAALGALRAGGTDALMVARLDRLTSSVEDLAYLMHRAVTDGFSIVAPDLGVDLDTDSGAQLARVLSVAATWHPRGVGRRTVLALDQRRETERRGRPSSTPVTLADRIRAMRASGATLQAICDTLNAEGPDPAGRHPLETHVVAGDRATSRRLEPSPDQGRGEHMTDLLEQRVEALERQLAELAYEVAGRGAPAPAVRPPSAGDADSWPRPIPPAVAPAPDYPRLPLTQPIEMTRRRRLDIEQLLGGRLLALVGGVAVVVGIAFFIALAVDHDWVGETERLLLAGAASIAFFGVGVWLYERKGRLQAALAVVGTAIAGMFLTLTAATAGYQLIPTAAAMPLALGVGALATTIAVRWDSRTVAGLGIAGTLAAPILGNAITTSGMLFLAVASASAAVVLGWRRWQWLAVGASGLVLAQVALWTLSVPPAPTLMVVLSAFVVINLMLALGYQVRQPDSVPQPSAALLVPVGALVLAGSGYLALPHGVGEADGGLWVVGLAVAHALLAGVTLTHHRLRPEVGLLLMGVAVALGDVAFGLLGRGWVLGVGWAAASVGFALLARRVPPQQSRLVYVALGVSWLLRSGMSCSSTCAPTSSSREAGRPQGRWPRWSPSRCPRS